MEQHQTDFKALLDTLLPLVEEMLRKCGELRPIGATMNAVREIAFVAAYDEEEPSPSTDLIEMTKTGFAAQAKDGDVRATALAYDIFIKRPDGQSSLTPLSLRSITKMVPRLSAPFHTL